MNRKERIREKKGKELIEAIGHRVEQSRSGLIILSVSIHLSTFLTHSIFYFVLSLTECTNTVKGKENSITPRKAKKRKAMQGMAKQPAIFHSDDHRDVWQIMTMDLISFRLFDTTSPALSFPFLSHPILSSCDMSYRILSYLIISCILIFSSVMFLYHDMT